MADILILPPSIARRQRRLRLAGWLVLALGVGGAWLLYWLRTRAPDVLDDPSMSGFDRAQTRQMGELYGTMGLLTKQFLDAIRQPGTQSQILAAAAILVALGCFHFARLLGREEEPDTEAAPEGRSEAED